MSHLPSNDRMSRREVEELCQHIEQYAYLPWSLWFLTFMFRDIRGPRHRKIELMRKDLDRFYYTLAKRTHRRLNSDYAQVWMPFIVGAFDLPGSHGNQLPLDDLVPNDGLHAHGVAAMPLVYRMEQPLNLHLVDEKHRYIHPEFPLVRVDVERIQSDPSYVTDYAIKALKKGLLSRDELIILRHVRSKPRL